MPWKKKCKIEQRLELVRQMESGEVSVTELCRRVGLSRPTAYKWWLRYRKKRLRGLSDKSRKPLRTAGQTEVLWLRRIRRARRKHPSWGARKLCFWLGRKFGSRGVPGTATVSRWLKRWGLAYGRKRLRKGPIISRKALHVPKRCHEVWTVDFKGWYRTGDGTRVEPLTVRDLYSRYVLEVVLLSSTAVEPARQAFEWIFKKHGLPRRIRCDNGTPFGGGGARGLTRLSAWWVKLGIEVQFITPGCPGENGGHEQFHRVYKAEVAREPGETPTEQQQKTNRWLRHYNQERPHEGIGMKVPSQVFKRNKRRESKTGNEDYPRGWKRCWVKGSGEIRWKGAWRFVGEGFGRNYVGLREIRAGVWEVYFGETLVGELQENESGRMRMAIESGARDT